MDDIVKNFLIEKLEEEIKKAEGEAEELGKWNAKCKSLQGEWKRVKNLIGEENRGKIGREKVYKCLNLTGEWCQLAKQAAECCELLKQQHKLTPKTLHLPFHKLGEIINQVKKELEDSIKSQTQQQQQQQVKKDIEDSVKAQSPQQQQQQQLSSPESEKPEIYRWSSHKSPPQRVHGFGDKIKVMERLLLKKETMAIGISGVAGVGKTLLAQEAYNSPPVKAQFLLRMWLCMSKQQGIAPDDPVKRMLRCLGFESDVVEKVGATTEKLRPFLRQQLSRGRFLIVLDDVWAVEEIDKAEYKELVSFLTADCGEGKVMVSSRSPEFEQVMGPENMTQRLLPLIGDSGSCWKIFKDAMGEKVTPEMKGLKKRIVGKCEGLPLMAKMLGKYGTSTP